MPHWGHGASLAMRPLVSKAGNRELEETKAGSPSGPGCFHSRFGMAILVHSYAESLCRGQELAAPSILLPSQGEVGEDVGMKLSTYKCVATRRTL